ncbi:MAG: hypothetical protein PHQ34_00375 [Methanothrix sp.]|nr:hypothetical protein [Methanothrix sp.]
MDRKKIVSDSEGLSEKKAYEPPRAMRLGDMRNGAGICGGTGSSDAECVADGNAAGLCSGVGSSESAA